MTDTIPFNTLNVDRSILPQIQIAHDDAFIDYLKAQGVSVERLTVPAASLKPTQGDYDQAKVAKIVQNWDRTKNDKPAFVSEDDYILDGHHRWVAALQKISDIPVFKADVPILSLLALAHRWPLATYKSLHEQRRRFRDFA
jgi:hypothetical protein